MQRGETRAGMEKSKSWAQNTFLLRRLGSTPTCPSVQVDFSQYNQKTQTQLLLSQNQAAPLFPIYNTDFCYFTPAFTLQVDKDKYIKNSETYLSVHQQKIQELSTQKTELLVPRPSRSNSFCCICKASFQDYLTVIFDQDQHVNMPRHQQLMHSSQFLPCITKLCTFFNKVQVEEPQKKKNTRLKKKISKADKTQSRGKKDFGSPLSSTGIHMDFSLSPKANEIIV